MRQAGYFTGGDHCGDGGGRDAGSGGVSCQDCGNKAKKECRYMRCRTCCRSCGLPCETHVKSTWVPAAKRRERRQQSNSGNQQLSLMIASDGDDGGSESIPKRFRDDRQQHHHIHGGAAVSTSDLQDTSSELGFHFPAELSSPALFRRVRVSGVDETNTNHQLAYQTAIRVGGHVYNGILYDHGPDQGQFNFPVGESTSAAVNQHQDVNLITSVTTATGNSSSSISQAVTIIDPSSMRPTPLCAFIAGTQFFPPPRS